MEDYAVVKIAHRQYIVEPGKEYVVDKFVAEPGDKLDLEVLARGKGDKFDVGQPLVKMKAKIEVIAQARGEKINSRIFKSKSRYRRNRGHRKQVTKFVVLDIK